MALQQRDQPPGTACSNADDMMIKMGDRGQGMRSASEQLRTLPGDPKQGSASACGQMHAQTEPPRPVPAAHESCQARLARRGGSPAACGRCARAVRRVRGHVLPQPRLQGGTLALALIIAIMRESAEWDGNGGQSGNNENRTNVMRRNNCHRVGMARACHACVVSMVGPCWHVPPQGTQVAATPPPALQTPSRTQLLPKTTPQGG